MKKSKSIFGILAVIAIIFLIIFSFALAEGSFLIMALSIILMFATFGVGFTLKKKYRENGWL